MNLFKIVTVILFVALHVKTLYGYSVNKFRSCPRHPWACNCYRPVILESRIADQLPIYPVLPSDYGETEEHLPIPIDFFDRSQELSESTLIDPHFDLEYVKDTRCEESTSTPIVSQTTAHDEKLLKVIKQVSPLLSDTFIPLDLIKVPLLNSLRRKTCNCVRNNAKRKNTISESV